MAVTLSTESQKEIPAVTLDHLHLDSFIVKQERGANPVKVVTASGCLYGEDAEGVNHYDTASIEARSKNVDAAYVQYVCAKTGQTQEEAIAAVATAKAQLTADYNAGTLTDAEIMAYAEFAISYFFQIMGKLELSGME
jgi:acetyl-CoA acetyltransferase